jgi:hypothetical protein
MSKDLKLIHQEALLEFDEIQTAVQEEREQCLEDRRFYSIAGAQWEGKFGNQFENKPKLEFNKVHLSIMKIISEYRNNQMSVNFISKDGMPNNVLANTCSSLYRADEQDSVASEAYDNAFEEAVGGGFGAFRYHAEYVDDEDAEDESQRIRILPIFDADTSVFFDLNAKRQDKSDARSCYIVTAMSPRAYEAEYDDDPASLQKVIGDNNYVWDWSTPDVIYIAEYFVVENIKEIISVFIGLDEDERRVSKSDIDKDDTLLAELKAAGYKKDREKKITSKVVRKYIINGAKVLEDCGVIVGKNIPVVPVYGKRWYIENIERCMGHVRLAKDPQRLKNMQVSQLAILSAVSQTEKPIFFPEQIAGHELTWAEDNIKNNPYLLVNPTTDAEGNILVSGPIGYTKPPMIAPALAALLALTDLDIKEILGGGQINEEITANLSGVAVEQIHQRQDMQSFIYLSNMSKAIQRGGEIWLSMAQDVFIEPGRKLKALDRQGNPESVEILKKIIGKKTNSLEIENDLSEARFDVAVEVGPTSSSRKQSTVRTVMSMIPLVQDPELQQALALLAASNMEGEGLEEFTNYLRKRSISMGIVKPNEEELAEIEEAAQNQRPDANTEFLQASAKEAEAKAKKTEADTIQSLAKTELVKADTVATMAGIEQADKKLALEASTAIGKTIDQEINSLGQKTENVVI